MAVIDQRRVGVRDAPREVRSRRHLPVHESKQQLKLGSVPQINATAFAAPGRAIAQVGNAVSDLGGRLGAMDDKKNDFRDALAYTKFQNQNNQDYMDHDSNSSEDGQDYSKNWSIGFGPKRDEFLGEISPKNRDKYTLYTEKDKGSFEDKSSREEYRRAGDYQTKQLVGHVFGQSQVLMKSPTPEALEQSLASSEILINATKFSEDKKEVLRHQHSIAFKSAYVKGLALKDPAAAQIEYNKLLGDLTKTSDKATAGKVSSRLPNNNVGKALGYAAEKHGVSPDVIASIVKIESGFNPRAKNPNSSARGLGQFINSTGRQYGLKNDGSDSVQAQSEALARFTKDNIRSLQKSLKREPTAGEVYLAHFAGVGRAKVIGRASDKTPISSILSPKAIAANRSILAGKTVGQVKAWAEKKMGSIKVGDVKSNYIPKQMMTQIAKLGTSIDKAVIKQQEATAVNALKGQSSIAVQDKIDQLSAAKNAGQNIPDNILKAVEKHKTKLDAGLKNDPLGYANDEGTVKVPLLYNDKDPVKGFQERVKAAETVAERYGSEFTLMRPEEKTMFKNKLDTLEPEQKLIMMAAIDRGFGKHASKLFGEFSKSDIGFAHTGGLYLKGKKEAASLALSGFAALRDKSARQIIDASIRKSDVTSAFQEYYGDAFANSPVGVRAGFMNTAHAIAGQLILSGVETVGSEALNKGMQLASGYSEDAQGNQYGGVGEFNDQSYMVDPNHKASDVDRLFEHITDGEPPEDTDIFGTKGLNSASAANENNFFLKKDGINPTNPITQRPVTAEELHDAQFVSVGQGRYLIMVDGLPLRDGRQRTDLGNNKEAFTSEYVLDIGQNLEVILKLINPLQLR